jgi:hypothetical protein
VVVTANAVDEISYGSLHFHIHGAVGLPTASVAWGEMSPYVIMRLLPKGINTPW